MHCQRARKRLGRQRASADVECQMEVAKDFEGIYPRFEVSGFVSEQSGTRPNDRKKLPAANRPCEFGTGARVLRKREVRWQTKQRKEKQNSKTARKMGRGISGIHRSVTPSGMGRGACKVAIP